MKKSLLLLAFCMYTLGASAQITLSNTDIAGPQKVIYQATDNSVASSMIGFAGPSQSWNMTSLTADVMDTMTFLPYSYWPNNNFSSSNLLMKLGYTNSFVYLSSTTGSLLVLGIGIYASGSQSVYKNTPSEILMNFPATYNTTFTNSYVTKTSNYYGVDPGVGFVIDSVRTRSYVKKTVIADAWGTLSTPLPGGPYAVLRIKETKITHDTTDAFFAANWTNGIDKSADSSTVYTWWAKNMNFPLASAAMDSTGNVVSMEWLKGSSLVGVNEQALKPGLNVYPNPARDEINFVTDDLQSSTMRVYDITGKLINEYTVKGNRLTVNTTAYSEGIYTYSVIGENNTVLKQGKFTILK